MDKLRQSTNSSSTKHNKWWSKIFNKIFNHSFNKTIKTLVVLLGKITGNNHIMRMIITMNN